MVLGARTGVGGGVIDFVHRNMGQVKYNKKVENGMEVRATYS